MALTLDPTTAYIPTPDAIESRLGEETVILHISSGMYFGLDAVGTVVWEQLGKPGGMTPNNICAHVRSTFADTPASVDDDVTQFLVALAEENLIQHA